MAAFREPLNESSASATAALRDVMHERRRSEWPIPFARSLTKQTARKALSLRVAATSSATAKGGAVSSEGRCDPVAGCSAQATYNRSLGARRCPIPASLGPSGDAFGRHRVALLGIVEPATTCVVRLVIIPILSATRPQGIHSEVPWEPPKE